MPNKNLVERLNNYRNCLELMRDTAARSAGDIRMVERAGTCEDILQLLKTYVPESYDEQNQEDNFKELERRFFGSEYEFVKDLPPYEKLQKAAGSYPLDEEQREVFEGCVEKMSAGEIKAVYQGLIEAAIIDMSL